MASSGEPCLVPHLGLAATCVSHSDYIDEEYKDAYVSDVDMLV